MLLPQMVPVLKHVYLSSVHPLAYDTQELQRENIRVVISLLEEIQTPSFVREQICEIPFVKHQYYSIRDQPDTPIRNIFFSTSKIIIHAIENERNVLIYCRSGQSLCVTILIACLVRCTYKNWQQYILPLSSEPEPIHSTTDLPTLMILKALGLTLENAPSKIPQTHHTWTETYLAYIQNLYPAACPNPGFMTALLEYERQLAKETQSFVFE